MKINREQALKLADFLEKLPPQNFNMSDWISSTRFDEEGYEDYSSHAEIVEDPFACDTQACVAGWAVLHLGTERHKAKLIASASTGICDSLAADILGADNVMANALFYGNWRTWYGDFDSEEDPPTKTPKDAAKELRYLAKEYGS